ncbi:nitroreductase [gamma proteobacterium HTCC5015]|nr:nitroreductase [gamma proteobacterium HTCC5015]
MTETDTLKHFREVVTSRRSVKRFTDERIPEEVLQDCFDLALLAPNSSNLQPWSFIRIVDPAVREQANRLCLGQNAAKTASELIAIVAHTDTWADNAEAVLQHWPVQPVPEIVKKYYQKLVPLNFRTGPMNAMAPLKKGLVALRRQRQSTPDMHYSEGTIKLWAVKSTALAAENLMLALRAHDFDSCPMEGFDEAGMKKQLHLGKHEHIVMMIGAGRRAENGIYHPQFRLPREQFIKEI